MRDNWATLWETVCDAMPDATAIVHGARRLTYREVEQRAARLSAALIGLGLGRDSKVGILAYNCPEYMEASYAAFKLRGSPVNLNYRYREDELTEVLADSDAEVLFFHGALGETAYRAAQRLPGLHAIVQIDDGSPMVDGAHDYESLISGHDPAPRIERSGEDVFLLYTGGTTGRPRGVMWRHQDIVSTIAFPAYTLAGLEVPADTAAAARGAVAMYDAGLSPVVLPAPPLIHGTAFYMSKGSWLLGGTVVLLENRRLDGHELWGCVQGERVTQVIIVGDPFARAMVRALEEADRAGTPYDISSLRRIASSGVLWSAAWKQPLVERGEVTLTDMVGASEGGPFTVQVVPPGARASECRFELTPRARLIDEHGALIDPASGRTGRLAVPPPGPLGYYKDPEKSAALRTEIDGVAYTVPGDYAYLDAHGEVVLLGRGALCINTGGEKVYPQEVETAIAELDGVRDVNVIGLPDEEWGEAVTAVVAADRTSDTAAGPGTGLGAGDVREAVRARLAGYKVPKHVVFVEEILRTPAGKARYAWAREVALAELQGGRADQQEEPSWR
jgi:acyl-CoA synthetase (AMP-forming)/AMP-acid ligase II